ncbi:hypothetical protein [uncultured Sphaerotilus sp.]|uniref:hypothetical protein n=1 Tax=uncultured Sphaerotilus sp. TaxID=474984 RepID=UPI0030CA5AED
MSSVLNLRPLVSPASDQASTFGDQPSTFSDPSRPTIGAPILLMRHPQTGETVEVPIGYSWPVLLFGPVVLARRRDWRLALVCLLLPLVGQVFLARTANRAYLNQLLRRGFRAVSTERGRVSQIEWQLGMQLPRYTGRSSRSAG